MWYRSMGELFRNYGAGLHFKGVLSKTILKRRFEGPIHPLAHLTQRAEVNMVGYGLRPALLLLPPVVVLPKKA